MKDAASRIMQHIPDMVAYLDTELRYLYTNDAYQKAFGRSAEEFLGKTVFDMLPQEVIESTLPRWRQALQGKEVAFDSQINVAGAKKQWLYARVFPDLDDAGRVAGIFAILSDVTARKDMETRLRRLWALNDDLPSMLAHCDAQERYLYVNRAYAATYGRTPDEVLGLRVQDVISPELYERITPHIKTLLQGKPVEFETMIPQADGTRPWMAIRGIPERSEMRVVGFFVNISDVSKHKELEKLRLEFASGNVRAQEAERKALAQELHDGIAQELAALAVISNVLERKTENTKAADILRMLQEGLQRTVHETRRLSYGLHPLELTKRGLVKAIEELLSRTRQVHDNVTITFNRDDTEFERGSGPDIDIAVYRIVQEAFSNAMRHAKPSRIELSLQRDNDALVGTILDDGTGFDANSPHSGFGLVSIRERAMLLDGVLSIQSSSAGTRIEFRLPIKPQGATQT